jgi:cardiolipin synthase
LGHKITGNPLVAGNRVALLKDGDDAFPAKLAAIERAKASIALLTCIFDSDPAGEMSDSSVDASHQAQSIDSEEDVELQLHSSCQLLPT